MKNGSRDTSTPITDATVQINNGCSGVLITPELVLTAGHCIPDRLRPSFPRRGGWNRLSTTIPISFGNDRRNFKLTRWAREYNPAGLIDISLLRLTQPIPPSVAQPARVMTLPPSGVTPERFLKGKRLIAAGWGVPGAQRYRQTGVTNFNAMPYDQFGTREPARFRTRGSNELQPGDSGSPIYWESPKTGVRHVVGIAQGVEGGGGRYYSVASHGGVEPKKKFRQPSLASWLDRELAASLPEAELLPLFSWWDKSHQDNYATTTPGWGYTNSEWAPSGLVHDDSLEHIVGGRAKGSHRLYRHEGYLFDPHEKQPAGTVPVFGWHNTSRGDHFLSSDPRYAIPVGDVRWRNDRTTVTNRVQRSGYRLRRLEGFAFDPKRRQPPGTIPLFSWWRGSRQDNFASTDPRWSGDPAGLRWNGEHLADQVRREGYSRYRLEGFVLPPLRT